jgi:Mg-chelatase subunit ChlI
LYVDEVNLLEDHIVDVLLDVAAMGVNVVEREGVSHAHPSSFVLVGTMNPEEGELRPQLLDRFGLCVDVVSSSDVAERAEIVARRLAFERDGASFAARFSAEERALGLAIAEGRARLGDVAVEAAVCEAAARLAVKIGVDGHRAEILTVKAAATLAAFERKSVVGGDDIARAAELVFPHRVKRQPFEERTLSADELATAVREAVGDKEGSTPPKKGRAVSPGA